MSGVNATTNATVAMATPQVAGSQERIETSHRTRLAPIEEPRGLKLRFAYWGMRHWVGKVLTPAKVLYARVPESMIVVSSMQKFQKKVKLELSLQLLIGDLTSQINGCSFCEDIGRALAVRQKLGLERKFDALLNYRTDPAFSARERAALAYVEEATRNKLVSDATFEALRAQFSEREIVEITLLNAMENLYNLTNLPLGIGSDGLCALAQRGPNRSRSG
jgi:alkylhydroperoxidase family enzyme